MTTKKSKSDIDAVKLMRNIRDKMSKDMTDMSFQELKAYFKKRKEKFSSTAGKVIKKQKV